MTTEREILEFSAKACKLPKHVDGMGFEQPYPYGWNPLTNSADCAAMCAKLSIDSDWYIESIRMASQFDDNDEQHESWEAFKDHNNDRESAWRYAATMVAAKIGGMK